MRWRHRCQLLRLVPFGPRYYPGVRRGKPARDEPARSGYVYAGDYAGYGAHPKRDPVEDVFDSARPRSRGCGAGRYNLLQLWG